MGDAMCQMRGLKEYKDRHPDATFDFITCEYLHALMALHTDLFENVQLASFREVNAFVADIPPKAIIEFDIDWDRACTIGILKAWCEKTLGFIPTTDQPYYIVREEERIVAKAHAKRFRGFGFEKLALLQLDTPSGAVRSFKHEDWDRVLDLIPEDVGILYPGPVDLALDSPMRPRKNLFLLPGYDIGTTAALMQEVDYVFGAHGGTIMLAHAVGKQEVTQVMFLAACHPNILNVPAWDNLAYPNHDTIDWEQLRSRIHQRLTDPLPISQTKR
jgi:hypothetical protein